MSNKIKKAIEDGDIHTLKSILDEFPPLSFEKSSLKVEYDSNFESSIDRSLIDNDTLMKIASKYRLFKSINKLMEKGVEIPPENLTWIECTLQPLDNKN